jgi:cyanophycinase-like exopeptidase
MGTIQIYMKRLRTARWLIIPCLLSLLLYKSIASAQDTPRSILIPIGGGYTDIYGDFTKAVIERATTDKITILVLPALLSSDAMIITPDERDSLLKLAENRRFQLEESCRRFSPTDKTCDVTLVPVLVRSDALNTEIQKYFNPTLSAIFILDGDPTIAMQVIGATPIELSLIDAKNNGTIISGTGAGANLLSLAMIGKYKQGFSGQNSMNFGALDLWNNSERHGLVLGLRSAVIDHSVFQQGRLARLLQAVSLPENPHLGIGLDTYTGAQITSDRLLEQVFGLYTITVIDTATYHAADRVQYLSSRFTLSLRNVLVHLVAPGDFSYDLLDKYFHIFGPDKISVRPLPLINREFSLDKIPDRAGMLILSGGIAKNSKAVDPILAYFLSSNRINPNRIVIHANGYASDEAARQALAALNSLIGGSAQVHLAGQPIPDTADYDAIILIGDDQSNLSLKAVDNWLKEAWLDGKPIFADDASAALLGAYYSAHPPTPLYGSEFETAVQKSFLNGSTKINPGLALVNTNIEPRLFSDNRWGRIFSLAYHHPDFKTIGLNESTAIILDLQGARVIGDNAAIVLDLSQATLAYGTNEAFAIANGLIDVFVAGENLELDDASLIKNYQVPPTPNMPTSTITTQPTQIPTPTSTLPPTTKEPTRTPRPTATPPTIPPPSNPGATNVMVIFGTLIVIIIVIGIWMNRHRLN